MDSAQKALEFLRTQDRPVELAWVRFILGEGSNSEVVSALAGYQNADGGFGRNLEVDIAAPASQPFAVRLAMRVLIETGIQTDSPIVTAVATWLEREQGDDGCWQFPPAVFDHPIAPWFAGWTFPSLNPAVDLAGFAARLGVGSVRLFDRVDELWNSMASLDDARNGDFYTVLPYAEYVPWVEFEGRETFLDAIATGMADRDYDDAGHFFEHAGPAGNPLAARLSPTLIDRHLDVLQAEQVEDGGWPSPYNPVWRAFATGHAVSILKSYGRW